MKKFLFGALGAILTFAFIHPIVRAQSLPGDSLDIQSTQAVAFLKTDRSIIYIKRPGQPVDAYDIQQLDTTGQYLDIADPNPMDSIRNIGIIGMTPQGNRLVIGATVYYLNSSNNTHVRFVGFLTLPWPMTDSSLNETPINYMLPVYPASFRPSGVMSADGSEWWAVASSYGLGNSPLVFYHGRTDGSGTFDMDTVTSTVAGGNSALEGSYQVSNLTIDQPSKTMFATSFDGLQSQLLSGRALFYRWNPDKSQPLTGENYTTTMTALNSAIKGDYDSIYGLTVVPAEDAENVYIGCTGSSNNSIGLYKFYYPGTSIVFSQAANTIPRSAIPTSENFFAGQDCSSVTPPYSETIGYTNQGQPGNSGDMSFSVWGDTAVFITHEAPDNCNNRGVGSAIWTYDIALGTSTFIYNDSSAQELQPVFVTAMDTIPHFPGITQDVTTKDFGTVDTAKTATETITITDTSIFDFTQIDSAKITGTNASDFTITSPTQFPYTLNRRASVPISITFAPTMTQGSRSATLTVYSSMSTDQSLSVSLTGMAAVQQKGSVAEDPALAANIEIDPNPFNSQTSVRLTAQDAGTLGIVVHDALGRMVYTSDLRRVSAGTTETFAFDAKSLGLASGVYVVTGLFGDQSASREVVLAK